MVSFGVKTSQANIDYADIVRIWRDVDATDVFAHAWLWDHLVPLRGPVDGPALEAWTLLAALAARTRRVELGVIVTSNRVRAPAVLAKMAATVDVISGGRLVFGIGSGGSRLPHDPDVPGVHRELDAYGLPVVSAGEAVGALGEACALIRRMWTEPEPFDFAGKHYQLLGAICEPKPVRRPPMLIGGAGERRTLRIVAEHADVWHCPVRTADEFRAKSLVLDEHCAATGRDPAEITRSVPVLVRPDDDAAELRDRLSEFIAAGVTHIVLAPIPPMRPVRWLADEIAIPLSV